MYSKLYQELLSHARIMDTILVIRFCVFGTFLIHGFSEHNFTDFPVGAHSCLSHRKLYYIPVMLMTAMHVPYLYANEEDGM